MPYYHDAPGYGTQQFMFAPPPQPTFRPEPTWSGRDYYNAAAISPDMSLYDTALNRVRSGAQGVGFHEARHWHRRAYGGLVDLSTIAPNELGAAAGYEAYRNWIHNSSMYEPLMPDDERQREAMVGLAVAEVTRLWHASGRRLDRYGLQAASEAAAATASIIMGQWNENEYANNQSTIGSSMGAPPIGPNIGSPYGGQAQLDPYAYDEALYPRRSRQRHRRASSLSPPSIINIGGGAGPQQPYYSSGSSAISVPAYGTHVSPMPQAISIAASAPGSTIGGPAYGSGYGVQQPVTLSYGGVVSQPGTGILAAAQPATYQQPMVQTFPSAMSSMGGQPMGNTVVIPPPPGRHRGHRSRSRRRDEDRDERRERRARRYSDAAAFGNPVTVYNPGYGAQSVVGGTQYRY